MKPAIKVIIVIAVLFTVLYFINSDHWDRKSCNDECIHRGHDLGECKWPDEKQLKDVSLGDCLVKNSKHCGNEAQCECYCS